MNIADLDTHNDELCTFANIEYTPAWYYRILAGQQGGVWTEEQCLKEEEESEGRKNKKRRIESMYTEESKDGVHSEFQTRGEIPIGQP